MLDSKHYIYRQHNEDKNTYKTKSSARKSSESNVSQNARWQGLFATFAQYLAIQRY